MSAREHKRVSDLFLQAVGEADLAKATDLSNQLLDFVYDWALQPGASWCRA